MKNRLQLLRHGKPIPLPKDWERRKSRERLHSMVELNDLVLELVYSVWTRRWLIESTSSGYHAEIKDAIVIQYTLQDLDNPANGLPLERIFNPRQYLRFLVAEGILLQQREDVVNHEWITVAAFQQMPTLEDLRAAWPLTM